MADLLYKLHGSNPIAAIATATLNALANGAGALSGVLSNTSDGYRFGLWALDVAFATAPSADQTLELWYVQSLDGSTDWEDGSQTGPVTSQYLAHVFTTRAVGSLKRVSPLIAIPPYDFKVLLVNKAGVSLHASTSCTLDLLKVTEKSV